MTTPAFQLPLFMPTDKWKKHLNPEPFLVQDYHDPFLAAHAERLAAAGNNPLVFDEDAWDHEARGAIGIDVESYVNFFVICIKRFADGKRLSFELSNRTDGFNRDLLLQTLRDNTIISFNGVSYDVPMIFSALSSADTVKLKATSDRIISGGIKPWAVEDELGIRIPKLNHIDLMEPNPAVRQGLKILQGRLHCRFVVDLPYEPEATLTPEQMNIVTLYCQFNDLDATETLYRAMRKPLELRVALGRRYGMDLRSKSDSQVGEAIVKRRVESVLKRRIDKNVAGSQSFGFGYVPPTFIKFEGTELNIILDKLQTAKFHMVGEKPSPPEFLRNLRITIGNMTYSMGIGGLHSTEAHRALCSNNERFLLDVDVASQYPSIIMRLGLCPQALGPAFLKIYGELIKERLAGKASGDMALADGGRVALNGVFGKLGSPYSCMFSPDLLIAVTLTGQLSILMLIERAEAAGIPVVSANTDGVVFYAQRTMEDDLKKVIISWEQDTGFMVERTEYRELYNSSVNTYIAIKENGKVKRKGAISDPWAEGDLRGQMMKNPQMTVCSGAVVRYLTDNVAVEETIEGCRDPRAFVTVQKVTGGATWRGHYLGRAVRYYWSKNGAPITYSNNGNRVPKTEGAHPLMELTDELPPDIDYLRYFAETYRLAEDMGIRLE